MKLPSSFTTVTPLSKTIALILFAFLPIFAFFLGVRYQQKIDSPLTTIETLPTTVTPTPVAYIKLNSCDNLLWGFGLPKLPVGWNCTLQQPNIPSINFKTATNEEIYKARNYIAVVVIESSDISISIGQFSHDRVCQPPAMYPAGEACTTVPFYKDDRLTLSQHKVTAEQKSDWTIAGFFYGDSKGCYSMRCQNVLIAPNTKKVSKITPDLTKEQSNQIISILQSIQFKGI